MPFDVSIIIGSGSLSKLRNPNTMFYKTNQYIIFNIKFQLIYSLLSDYYHSNEVVFPLQSSETDRNSSYLSNCRLTFYNSIKEAFCCY